MNKKERRAAAQAAAAVNGSAENAPETTSPETSKEAQPETMAAFLDRLIAGGGKVEEIVAEAKAEAEKRGLRTKFNAGTIQGHINFRAKQAAKKAQKVEETKEVEA